MSRPYDRFRKPFSNNHIERTGGRTDTGPSPRFHVSKRRQQEVLAHEASRRAWEQSLPCHCNSGLPILKRAKRQGKWLAWCKKCDPCGKPQPSVPDASRK